MNDNIVKIYKEGNLIRFLPPTDFVNQAICEKLTYTRIVNVRPKYWERRYQNKKFDYIPVSCYKYVTINKQPFLVTNAGYLHRISKCLKNCGYQLSVKNLRSKRKFEKPDWNQLNGFTLRTGQREVLEALSKFERGQICYPTGAGKSFLMGLFCKMYPKSRIIITTFFDSVLQQHYTKLSQLLPSVGIYSSRKRVTDRRVMCYSAKSLHHADFDKCDVLLADESHELATDKMFEVFAQFRFSRMYAFSANYMDRFDSADFELEGVFGPLLLKMDYQEGIDGDLVVPIKVQWRSVHSSRNPCAGIDDDVEKARAGLWRNDLRNKLIAQDAKQFDAKTQVLITVRTLEHACYLKKELPNFTICYSDNDANAHKIHEYKVQGLLPENEQPMTRERLYEIKKEFETGKLKKVIATTVWNRGVDFTDLGVLIRADASSSKIDDTQVPGRLSRTGSNSDKQYGLLIDYLDEFDPGFHNKAKRRQKDYAAKHWEQYGPEGQRLHFNSGRKANKPGGFTAGPS